MMQPVSGGSAATAYIMLTSDYDREIAAQTHRCRSISRRKVRCSTCETRHIGLSNGSLAPILLNCSSHIG